MFNLRYPQLEAPTPNPRPECPFLFQSSMNSGLDFSPRIHLFFALAGLYICAPVSLPAEIEDKGLFPVV